MLSGQGSDELFCGYNSYVRYLALNSIQRIPLASQALKLLHRRLDGRTIDYLEQRRPLTFVGTAHVTTPSMRRQMFVDVPPLENHPLIRNTQPGLTPLRDALIFDQLVRLPNDILASTDRATIAAGIEARVPFLDRRVIQAANALADDCCLHPFSFQTKRILKLILNKYLPAELVYRKKVGFDLPIGDWLVTYFRAMAADFLEARVVPCVNYSFWSRLYEMHCTGVSDYAAPIWAWFMLERWYRRWVVNTTTGCPRNLSMLVG